METWAYRPVRVVEEVLHRVARPRERLLEDPGERRHRRVVVLPVRVELPERALERVRQVRVLLGRVESVCACVRACEAGNQGYEYGRVFRQ